MAPRNLHNPGFGPDHGLSPRATVRARSPPPTTLTYGSSTQTLKPFFLFPLAHMYPQPVSREGSWVARDRGLSGRGARGAKLSRRAERSANYDLTSVYTGIAGGTAARCVCLRVIVPGRETACGLAETSLESSLATTHQSRLYYCLLLWGGEHFASSSTK